MGQTIKKILSPAVVKAVDTILEQKHAADERVKDDIRRNHDLLRPDGDVCRTQYEAQAGRRLLRSDFVRRLQKLNPQLQYERSVNYPKQGGLYFVGLRGNEQGSIEQGKWFVAGLPHEVVNEFSTPMTVPAVVPALNGVEWQTIDRVDHQEPGWRSILLTLLKLNLLTPAEIDKEFEITKGRSSQRWQAALQ